MNSLHTNAVAADRAIDTPSVFALPTDKRVTTTVMAKNMTSDELRAKLEEVDRDQLMSLITQLADEDDGIRDRAEALALRGEPTAHADTLKQRLERWKRARHFISYSESTAFARQLDIWLDELEEELLAVNPEATWELADAFLRSDRQVFDRADDSNGAIGDAYRRSCGLWLRAAAKLGASPAWVDRLHSLHSDNDYGVRDALLDGAGTLLSELELRRLAKIYEQEFRTEAKRTTEEPSRSLAPAAAMGQVALAAGDAELYERSVRLHSPQPNTLQAQEIAKQYVRFGPVDKALPWLTGAATVGSDVDRLGLLAEAYGKLGNRSRLLEVRCQLWENTLSAEALREYIELLPPSERYEARRHAIEKASHSDDVVLGTTLLLSLGESANASAVAWRLRDRLVDAYYTHLIDLAKQFEAAECALGAVLCLRALIDQILAAGQTKTYRYAKRYLDRLVALDGCVRDYREVPDHRGYLEHLRETHSRKRSFWKLVDG